jgi:hypothetical protein
MSAASDNFETADELAAYIAVNGEGLANRNNHPAMLIRQAVGHLDVVRQRAWSSVPAPLRAIQEINLARTIKL